MIGSLIAGFVGGAIVGSAFGGGETETVVKKYIVSHQNELIGYHKYLERKAACEARRKREFEIWKEKHCMKCNDEIKFDIVGAFYEDPDGKIFEEAVVVTKCLCGQIKHKTGRDFHRLKLIGKDKDFYASIRKAVEDHKAKYESEVK